MEKKASRKDVVEFAMRSSVSTSLTAEIAVNLQKILLSNFYAANSVELVDATIEPKEGITYLELTYKVELHETPQWGSNKHHDTSKVYLNILIPQNRDLPIIIWYPTEYKGKKSDAQTSKALENAINGAINAGTSILNREPELGGE